MKLALLIKVSRETSAARSTDAPGHRGVSAFLVPADTPGPTRRPVHGKLGLRGRVTAELVLEDVRVPGGLGPHPRRRPRPRPRPRRRRAGRVPVPGGP